MQSTLARECNGRHWSVTGVEVVALLDTVTESWVPEHDKVYSEFSRAPQLAKAATGARSP